MGTPLHRTLVTFHDAALLAYQRSAFPSAVLRSYFSESDCFVCVTVSRGDCQAVRDLKALLRDIGYPESYTDGRGVGGETVLHLACESGNPDCVKLVVERDWVWDASLSLNTWDNLLQMACHRAAFFGNKNALDILWANGASFSSRRVSLSQRVPSVKELGLRHGFFYTGFCVYNANEVPLPFI